MTAEAQNYAAVNEFLLHIEKSSKFEHASELYRQGEEYYEQNNFAQAIAKWNEALSYLPAYEEYKAWQVNLLYFLASAHMQYYGQTKERQQLELAELKLDQYLALIDPNDSESRSAALQQKLEIYRLYVAYKQAESLRPAPEIRYAIPIHNNDHMLHQKPTHTTVKGLWIAGGVTSGAGLALLGTMTYALFWGLNIDQEIHTLKMSDADDIDIRNAVDNLRKPSNNANNLSLATGISGGILLGGGVAMLIAGAINRKKLQQARQKLTFVNSRIVIRF